ncbi:MAG: dihydroxy-acid dehydratase, partial [Pseudomonadota bacterium]
SMLAADAGHPRMCAEAGRRICDMVWDDYKPSDVLAENSFENAITVHMAMGGSTNAIIHVIAMARRAGVNVTLESFDRVGRTIPVLANVRPSGKYLMEDFYYAGGMRALMQMLSEKLDLDARTVNGRSIGENIEGAKVYNDDVIKPMSDPIYREGATAVLTGNLAPRGCVIKPSAVEPRLREHRGRALVFRDYNHLAAEINREDLECSADDILVLQNSGPKGGPGMPEWGMLPIPTKLVKQGVRDMLRISDARMSGTSYGACILHVAPESFVGGPLAFVQTGDEIEISVERRLIHLHVDEDELARRKANWEAPPPRYQRGYGVMFQEHIAQADEGCDFDFLLAGPPTPEPEIH